MYKIDNRITHKGFTLVEILVVIAVIGILASISVVGYGAWKKTATIAQIKSDLNAVASAMESARTFGSGYPQSPLATTLTTFSPSNDVIVVGGGAVDGLSYCVDGSSTQDASIKFYIASETKDKGPLSGICATRPNLPAPGVPSNLAITSNVGTSVGLSWVAAVNAATYTVQCASDAGFVLGVKSVTVASPTVTTTVTSLSSSSSYFCRINAVNTNSTSAWSGQVSTTTSAAYGSLAVAASVEGYWTTPPQGFLLEDGSAVSRTVYADLYGSIGTTFGVGDGINTFNLPDSRGRTTVNQSTDVEFTTIGQKSGSKTETITTAMLPSHTHAQNAHTHTVVMPGTRGGSQQGIFGDYAGGGGLSGGTVNLTTGMSAFGSAAYGAASIATNQSAGGGSPHNNIQPSIVKSFAIKYSPYEASAESLPAGTSIQGYWNSMPVEYATDYAIENGAQVSRTGISAPLFAAVGTTYGSGNGTTTFNVPNSQGRAAVNKSADVEFNVYGELYGTKVETISVATMPSHTHVQNAHQHTIVMPGTLGGTQQRLFSDFAGGGSLSSGVPTWSTNMSILSSAAYAAATTATNQSSGSGSSHNNIQPSITKLSVIKLTGATSTGTAQVVATSIQGYWTAPTAPTGYVFEDGAEYSRTGLYGDLFAAIGTTYGTGNGSTTFNVPNSQGRLAVNKSTDAEFNTMGEKYGEKSHILTITEMASHTHMQDAHSHTIVMPGTLGGNQQRIYGDYAGGGGLTSGTPNLTGGMSLFANEAYAALTVAVNQSTGSSGAHNEIQPSIVKMFAIKY